MIKAARQPAIRVVGTPNLSGQHEGIVTGHELILSGQHGESAMAHELILKRSIGQSRMFVPD